MVFDTVNCDDGRADNGREAGKRAGVWRIGLVSDTHGLFDEHLSSLFAGKICICVVTRDVCVCVCVRAWCVCMCVKPGKSYTLNPKPYTGVDEIWHAGDHAARDGSLESALRVQRRLEAIAPV